MLEPQSPSAPGTAAASPAPDGVCRLNLKRSVDEIEFAIGRLMSVYHGRIATIVKRICGGGEGDDEAKFRATFGRLADADGWAALGSAELTLPALVSGDKEVREASSKAKKELKAMWDETYSRSDLLGVLQDGVPGARTDEEKRLVQVVLARFSLAGAGLKDPQRAELQRLDARASSLAFQIEHNINQDTTDVALSEAQLEGLEADFIASLPKQSLSPSSSSSSSSAAAAAVPSSSSSTIRLCSTKAPVLRPIITRATRASTRRKMKIASGRRCVDENTALLEELLTVRHKAAVLLGFECHAGRMLSAKMAGSLDNAREFCISMLKRLAPLRDAELLRLQARKQKDGDTNLGNDLGQDQKLESASKRRKAVGEEGKAEGDEDDAVIDSDYFGPLQSWDVAFYGNKLKQEELHIDEDVIKQFFPLDGTVDRMLATYSDLLGLDFKPLTEAAVWHEDVRAFEVTRRDTGDVAGHLFLDQFPRPGKFGHQMIVPLAPSFVSGSGGRCVPACVNISNLPRPQGDKPALLRFAEMETLFHELGHAVHCLCTTTKYSILSWAWPMVPWPGGVEQDFLELPSMALEKFATDPSLLRRVSRHYTHVDGQKGGKGTEVPTLGNDTIKKLQELERWMQGTSSSRYYAMALFDLLAHSQAPPYAYEGENGLSVAELYSRVMSKHTKMAPLPDVNPCASWYHLVIGYDAGYYGYGWSDVYAADVFETMRKSKDGLISAKTGGKLRDCILAPCATRPGMEMLREFLGREPNSAAWCQRMGIPSE